MTFCCAQQREGESVIFWTCLSYQSIRRKSRSCPHRLVRFCRNWSRTSGWKYFMFLAPPLPTSSFWACNYKCKGGFTRIVFFYYYTFLVRVYHSFAAFFCYLELWQWHVMQHISKLEIDVTVTSLFHHQSTLLCNTWQSALNLSSISSRCFRC